MVNFIPKLDSVYKNFDKFLQTARAKLDTHLEEYAEMLWLLEHELDIEISQILLRKSRVKPTKEEIF
jgi:hypothetical protein